MLFHCSGLAIIPDMSEPSTEISPAPSTSSTASHPRARCIMLHARNISLIAAIGVPAYAVVHELFSLGLAGKIVVRVFLGVWGVAGLTFAGAGLVLVLGETQARLRRRLPSPRPINIGESVSIRLRGARDAIWDRSSKVTRHPETWPVLVCGALVALSVFGAFSGNAADRSLVAAWSLLAALLLGVFIAMVRFTMDSVREVNRSVDLQTLGGMLVVAIFEAWLFGAVISAPVSSAAFYAVAQIDAAVLIAAVVAADIPQQLAKMSGWRGRGSW